MAMMIRSQAQDRDEWQEGREERHQEFCVQIKMQHQQMQNQQNTMSMIMISMMGWNASVSVQNKVIMNMLAGMSNEQRKKRQGDNINDNQTEE